MRARGRAGPAVDVGATQLPFFVAVSGGVVSLAPAGGFGESGGRLPEPPSVDDPDGSDGAPGVAQLAQLAGMTTLSIDTGDLDILEAFAATGLITDATTNPLFVSQAGLSGDERYIAFVDAAIAYAARPAWGLVSPGKRQTAVKRARPSSA